MTSTRLHLTSYLILLPLLFPALTTAQSENDSALPTETATTIDTLAEVANTDVASASNLSGEAPVSATVESECRQIGDKLASISYDNCMASGLNLTGSASVKNIPILYRDFAPLAKKKPLGKVLLLGGVHGDEYSSISIVFKWMQTLQQFHSGMFHWRIIPLVNPDGLLQSESSRTNANGVDLNRNLPTPDWANRAMDYWKNRTDSSPRNFPGNTAGSEPETLWLMEEIEKFKPDVIISVHAPYGVVDFDGPEEGPSKLGRLYLNLLGTFPGSLGNYAGIQKNIPVVTIELPYAGIMPSTGEISNIWRDLVRWLTGNMPANNTVAQETDSS